MTKHRASGIRKTLGPARPSTTCKILSLKAFIFLKRERHYLTH